MTLVFILLKILILNRLDMAYIMQHLIQFLQLPRVPHFEFLKHILRYISAASDKCILLHLQSDPHCKLSPT